MSFWNEANKMNLQGKRKILGLLVCAGIMLLSLVISKYLGFSEGMFKIFLMGIGGLYLTYCGGNIIKEKIKNGGKNGK